MVERKRDERSAQKYLQEYIACGREFVFQPQITLELISRQAQITEEIGSRDIAVTTAVQCYAPGNAKLRRRDDERSEEIADSTLQAGHHTTRQHTHYTWHLTGVSRSLVHDVLHAHPFYNSEQQSQRYVEAKNGNYLIPSEASGLTDLQRRVFTEAASFANSAYFDLVKFLEPVIKKRMHQMYPVAAWRVQKSAERLDLKSKKLSFELARYVLPIGQKTTLYHTLNELQLLRLFRASQMPHFSKEAKYVVARMIEEIAKVDKTIIKELGAPAGVRQKEVPVSSQKLQEEFDMNLGNRQSILCGLDRRATRIILGAARTILGEQHENLSDGAVWKKLIEENDLLSDIYDIGMLDPLTSSLRQISLTFATKLSHTANSQRQRHRRTLGAATSILSYNGRPDYITPLVIDQTDYLKENYYKIMERIYGNIETCLETGMPREWALLLIPNAHAIRLFETGDIFDWMHRFRQRLCYLAQEEIFFISVDQVEQIAFFLPELEQALLAPCGLRKDAGVFPKCPEGDRWCGQPVYNWSIGNYRRNRLV